MSNSCMHYYVEGKVQGVWFRASTKEVADELGLTGWVRNLADGRVEIVACGELPQLEKLRHWLKKGPPLAVVNEVSYEELGYKDYTGFDIL